MAELSIGDQAPGFELPDTEGAAHAFPADGNGPAAIVFTCNHCPYALAWHDRILGVAREYEPRGVRVLLVNSNDAERYPRDSYEAMQARVMATHRSTATRRGHCAHVPVVRLTPPAPEADHRSKGKHDVH